jgi:hypothetical protein
VRGWQRDPKHASGPSSHVSTQRGKPARTRSRSCTHLPACDAHLSGRLHLHRHSHIFSLRSGTWAGSSTEKVDICIDQAFTRRIPAQCLSVGVSLGACRMYAVLSPRRRYCCGLRGGYYIGRACVRMRVRLRLSWGDCEWLGEAKRGNRNAWLVDVGGREREEWSACMRVELNRANIGRMEMNAVGRVRYRGTAFATTPTSRG